MKYESPGLDVIELDAVDVIQTSGGGFVPGAGIGGENELPFNPAKAVKAVSSDMDDTYNN